MINSLRTHKTLFSGGIIVVFALFITAFTVETAVAQEQKRSFFDILFGRKRPKVTQPQRQRLQPTIRRRQQPVRRPQQQTTTPRQTETYQQKNDTAKRILVIGDFVAAATAEGLASSYKDNPDINIINRTEGSSGLVRDDYYNWPVKISAILAKEKPDIIVVMLGSNDRQTMKLANKSLDIASTEWENNYQGRINALTVKLQQSGAQWLWLGLPAFKQRNLTESAMKFNAWYKQAAEKSGGHFIDIWSGFVDDNGQFALSGYDSNGQTARLRNNDGISFTPAGKRKLAFYAEQVIGTLLSNQQPADALTAEPMGTAARPNIEHIAPTSLWDISGSQTGLYGAPAQSASSPRETHSETGFRPQAGRADDFGINKE